MIISGLSSRELTSSLLQQISPLLCCLSLKVYFLKKIYQVTTLYRPLSTFLPWCVWGSPVLPTFLEVTTDNLQMHNCWMNIIQWLPTIANISSETIVITLGCTRRALGGTEFDKLVNNAPTSLLPCPSPELYWICNDSISHFSKLYYKSRKYTFSGIGMPILQPHLARGLAAICLQAHMLLCGLGWQCTTFLPLQTIAHIHYAEC